REAIEASGPLPVPMKLRNAPTKLMRAEGYGQNYHDPHAHEGHVVPGETYLPDQLVGARFYEPTEQGFERRLREILAARRAARSGGQGEAVEAPRKSNDAAEPPPGAGRDAAPGVDRATEARQAGGREGPLEGAQVVGGSTPPAPADAKAATEGTEGRTGEGGAGDEADP
ncbi:MAG TPA: hypothetical protein VFS43_45015, partial [Polyangiaceae bacterium]|nr:hypothetical protein [Polyangiaceae bacterium]